VTAGAVGLGVEFLAADSQHGGRQIEPDDVDALGGDGDADSPGSAAEFEHRTTALTRVVEVELQVGAIDVGRREVVGCSQIGVFVGHGQLCSRGSNGRTLT